jgi:hypothetical protein
MHINCEQCGRTSSYLIIWPSVDGAGVDGNAAGAAVSAGETVRAGTFGDVGDAPGLAGSEGCRGELEVFDSVDREAGIGVAESGVTSFTASVGVGSILARTDRAWFSSCFCRRVILASSCLTFLRKSLTSPALQ